MSALVGCAGRDDARCPAPATPAAYAPANGRPSARGSAPLASTPDQVGLATWYGAALAGHKTANGERFNPSELTAAHRKLPFGTWVEVRRADTGAVVRVRINDRGPWGHEDRIIDVSRKAAEILGMVRAGVVPVELRVVRGP